MLPTLRDYVSENFSSQADAARSLHMSVQQFNRLVNGATPLGWATVGRMWYFWHHKKFLPDAETMIAIIGNDVLQREGGAS